MKKKWFLIALIALVTTFSLNLNAYAWYGSLARLTPCGKNADIHYTDTIKWCRSKGFNSAYSIAVGTSCDKVDIDFSGEARWHLDRSFFTKESEDTRIIQSQNEMKLAKISLDKTAELYRQLSQVKGSLKKIKIQYNILSLKKEACMYLGRSLHPIQDMYAHMDAGYNTPEDKLDGTHGMLDAPPVDVKVCYPDGKVVIRKMKLETLSKIGDKVRNYSLYDDPAYDYVNGEWVFIVNGKKENNSRWINTRNETYSYLDDFLNYANSLNISFSK